VLVAGIDVGDSVTIPHDFDLSLEACRFDLADDLREGAAHEEEAEDGDDDDEKQKTDKQSPHPSHDPSLCRESSIGRPQI
jgi:hypothetical protein